MSFAYVGEGTQILDTHLSVFLKPEQIRIGANSRVDAFQKWEGGEGIEIGDYCHLASFNHINGGGGIVRIGSHSGTASGVIIAGGMSDISRLHVTPMEPKELINTVRKETVIGEYVVLFSGAIVLPGVIVNHGAIIAAGAVITKDVPAFEIWGGVPGRKIGVREITK